ncbi:YitT family protein [Streptococcus sp. DD12]|uniref:YitT family protein n=1 Tax=Streptococcus sp. DD12 TaxID=1777880 RepID=UPI00079ABC0B|nr:YitT family protein [Streptococcus sp. DD12]KXT76076.1 Transporter [Streptococcus sp. DD12]
MKREGQARLALDLVLIALGVAIYSFGFVYFNMANHLAEGGISGVTLITHALFNINPAYMSLILNVPLFWLGRRIFGNKALGLTIYGTLLLSFFVWLWQKIPLQIDVSHDMLIAALLAGVFAGFGSGLVFRHGGTTGGGDIIGRVIEEKTSRPLGQNLFIFDSIVLLCSLSYIGIRQMVYTLIASFVYSQIMPLILRGGYAAKGMFIITDFPVAVAQAISENLERGATFINSEGAYTQTPKRMVYVIVNPREVAEVKHLLTEIDPHAFISIVDVDEIIGEGFTWDVKRVNKRNKLFTSNKKN